MFCADALIRSALSQDPYSLTDDEWVLAVFQAEYVENKRVVRMAKLVNGN